jgi:hypothetical protein
MRLNNPLDQCQSDTGPFTFGIQLAEQAEDFFVVARINPFAIVADKEDALLAILPRAYLDARRSLISDVFDGVFKQILHDLRDPLLITSNGGQIRLQHNFNVTTRDWSRQLLQSVLNQPVISTGAGSFIILPARESSKKSLSSDVILSAAASILFMSS